MKKNDMRNGHKKTKRKKTWQKTKNRDQGKILI